MSRDRVLAMVMVLHLRDLVIEPWSVVVGKVDGESGILGGGILLRRDIGGGMWDSCSVWWM